MPSYALCVRVTISPVLKKVLFHRGYTQDRWMRVLAQSIGLGRVREFLRFIALCSPGSILNHDTIGSVSSRDQKSCSFIYADISLASLSSKTTSNRSIGLAAL